MQQQQQELEKLMEERRRLLHMQTQLTKLQHQFPNSSSLSDERISLQQKTSKKICGNSLNSKSLSPCRQGRSDNCTLGRQNLSYEQPNTNMKSRSDNKKTVSKKENINSMSANLSGRIKDGKDDLLNSDVNDNVTMESLIAQTSELDNSLTLQEIKQNVLLEDILRQNHKHQGYSNNEDVRSRSGSSANSEFQEESNSILAPDTTAAATWGGSSTQNDFEDEPVESLEEQDGDGINRWNVKKNFHQEQQRNHISASHNQENVYGTNRLHLEEPVSVQNLISSDGTCNLTVWQQFTQHIHQQLEHMNTLCQSIFQDQQTLTSCLMSCSLSSPSLAVGRSCPVVSDILHQHTHQFQQQQQLLLSLSQCYHMIYLQQLEIQYLHQCLQQNSASEHTLLHPSSNVSQDRIAEDFTFRPWLAAPSANTHSSFPPTQASPISTSACMHSNTDNTLLPTTSNAPTNRFNLSTPISSNCNFARQTAVAATLNNQVPPRTRANNFWDNFRSCSRQNMLSTSKSNEIISANLSNPQIPDSIPTVSDHQPQIKNQSYSEKTANSDYGRTKARQVSNTKMHENIIKTKKPNSSKDRGLFSCFVNKPSSTQQVTSKSRQTERPIKQREVSASHVSDNNSIPNISIFSDTSNSAMPSSSNTRAREVESKNVVNTSTMQESVYAEVSKIISQADGQPEFLLDFLKKLKHLRLDSQQVLSSSQHMSSSQEDNPIKNKDRFIQAVKREQSDAFIDNSESISTQLTLSGQFPSKEMHEDHLTYAFSQPKEETEVVPSVAAATGAVRKRTYNKRAKIEPISISQGNGIGRNSEISENSSEKAEKNEPFSSNQDDLENRTEQEGKDMAGMDLSPLICQSNNRAAQIAEEDMIYECGPEGETEPDIEAETDDTKDLAEADQSPGQRTSVVDHVHHFRQIESPQLVSSLGNNTNNFVLINSGLRNESSLAATIDGLDDISVEQQDIAAGGEQISSCLDDLQTVDELPLDDIPTKLIPLSEGEISKQMAEEISAASLLQEVVSEELSDVVKEQSHF
ncbi:pericentriolar material 1 protein-like isoform X3 [Centruroides sculpturatus]|uniref:pericentriolar material 1 protein-like isoform X3 n=1 Tax=Centruroides sculpturatus TaxID=218467 RepID=UPI000C6D3F1B|nr:pericentriolar material 1 protein-like isoform X3 [Centruroides sculpturatus]